MASIEEKVEALIGKEILDLGYELYDVEYVKEGKDYYLRIYIDKDTGISLEDCELVSNNVSDILDTADYIDKQYFLEVSSPGVERILKKDRHLQANIGTEVSIKLFKSLEGKKQFKGKLNNFTKENIEILVEEKTINIDRKNIAQIKTIFNW